MTTLSCYHAVKRTDDGARPAPAASYINAVFVGDRSGSMSSMGVVPQEGAADFLRKHKELAENNPESEIVVTLVTFDNRPEVAFSGNAKSITELDIRRAKEYMIPRSTTRLIDTAIEQIDEQALAIVRAKKRWQDPRTRSRLSPEVRRLAPTMASSFTLLTDGDDNQSLLTSRDLNDAIKHHQKTHKTVCLFAAANQDAMRAGGCYGFERDRSLQIGSDVDSARAAFKSCNAAAVRSATGLVADYTKVEREASCSAEDFYGGAASDNYDSDDGLAGDHCPPPPPPCAYRS